MALNAAQQWWVRTGGNELNGGGYDATISGAGTNYADQDAAQLSLTDLTTAGVSATVGSVTGGFTSAMIGNIIRIASGTNFTVGYYAIVSVANTNAATLDRNCASGVGASGVCRVGGAHAGLVNYVNGGNSTTPIITSPLAPGHTINMRGAGTDDPSSADYSTTNFWQFPAGDLTNGCVTLVGYNGRPHLQGNGLTLHVLVFWRIRHFKFSVSAAGGFANYGIVNGNNINGGVSFEDVYFDQNGQDISMVGDQTAKGLAAACRCWAKNTGSTAAGTLQSFSLAFHGAGMIGCRIQDQRGWAMQFSQLGACLGNLITGCHHASNAAVRLSYDYTANPPPMGFLIWRNTIDTQPGSCLSLVRGSQFSALILNNIFSNASAYGIDATDSLGDAIVGIKGDYNGFYNNTSGSRHFVTAGAHDVALSASPYTGSGDYSLNGTAGGGAAAKEAGFPGTFPDGEVGKLDLGAVQHAA